MTDPILTPELYGPGTLGEAKAAMDSANGARDRAERRAKAKQARRALAHYRASDLHRAIVEQDTCTREYLTELRAENVDRSFRKLAEALGYTVEARQ